MLGLTLMIAIPILCAQIIWRVDIEAATPELEQRLGKTFQDTFQLETPLSKKITFKYGHTTKAVRATPRAIMGAY